MLKLRCKRHPRYTGERSPRASCDPCKFLYEVRLRSIVERIEIVGAKPTAKEAGGE